MYRPFVLLTLAGVVAVVGCGDDGTSPRPRQSRLEILPEHAHTAELHLGETIQLQPLRLNTAGAPLVNDTAVRFIWESSDTTVVLVGEDGLAEIVGLGEASVTLRVADRTNPTNPSSTDTASAEIELAGVPVVIHPGPLLKAFTGGRHQCVILASGFAECRGLNVDGQTGIGTLAQVFVAWTPVVGGVRFTSISGSVNHTCALSTEGRAYCWGGNDRAQLGRGSFPGRSSTPAELGGGHRWLDVHARGHSQSCGVTTENVPLCVGHNDLLQLGRMPLAASDPIVGEWGTGHRVVTIRTEDFHTCGLQTDGAVFCSGQRGAASNSTLDGTATLPNRIGGTVAFTTIAIGNSHGCGLDAAGAAHCWGSNEKGQLGTGDLEASGTARPIASGLTFERIYALDYSTCGVTRGAGETWCWGSNEGGTLGRTRMAMSPRPIRVNIGLGARSIDRYGGLGSTTACAVDGSGRLVCWGLNQPRS
jgi:alpha-tubulin suppressor-like RCC1 family protein